MAALRETAEPLSGREKYRTRNAADIFQSVKTHGEPRRINHMKTIAIFGGTTEGRLLAEALAGKSSLQCHVYAATEYGASLLPRAGNVIAHAGRPDGYAMKAELAAIRPDLVIDATHPYATAVSENLRRTSDSLRLTYIRIARQDSKTEKEGDETDSVIVSSSAQAAEFLNRTTGRILLTTGSRDLQAYTAVAGYQERIYARVLPAAEILVKSAALGYESGHMIAMQGPLSQGMNEQLIRDLSIRWLVTRESGMAGGYPEKCEAALALGCGLVIIGRPREYEDAVSLDAVIQMLAEHGNSPADSELGEVITGEAPVLTEAEDDAAAETEEGITDETELRHAAIVGIGPGNLKELTVRAFEYLREADLLVGSANAVETALAAVREQVSEANPDIFVSVRPSEIADHLRSHPSYRKTAVLYSGDVAFYSGAERLRELLPRNMKTEIFNGISSAAYFLGRVGVPGERVKILSLQRRDTDPVPVIRQQDFTLIVAGHESTVSELSERLVLYGLADAEITVGERLSGHDEEIRSGRADEFVGKSCDSLSLILIRNPHPVRDFLGFGADDRAFVRSRVTDRQVAVTEREIRMLALSMLRLEKDSVLYDIGAGTGAVSAEASRVLTEGHVYAIEQKPEAIELMRTNQIRWSASNMAIIEGHAPEAMFGLPAPSHAYISGSSGSLAECVEELRRRNERVRIVISAVTEETVREIWELRDRLEEELVVRITEIHVIRSESADGCHVKRGGNPVVLAEISVREDEPITGSPLPLSRTGAGGLYEI